MRLGTGGGSVKIRLSLSFTVRKDREPPEPPEQLERDVDNAYVQLANRHEPLGFTPNDVEMEK